MSSMAQIGNTLFQGQGGIDGMIQQLIDTDTTRRGTPPASTQAVTNLPKGKFKDLLTSDEQKENDQCSVCIESFDDDDDQVYKMPCGHPFHKECLMPWLEMHNSCPSCRHQLPTDDADYELRRNGQPSQHHPLM